MGLQQVLILPFDFSRISREGLQFQAYYALIFGRNAIIYINNAIVMGTIQISCSGGHLLPSKMFKIEKAFLCQLKLAAAVSTKINAKSNSLSL